MNQCVIYHWRSFNTFHSVLLVAEIAGASNQVVLFVTLFCQHNILRPLTNKLSFMIFLIVIGIEYNSFLMLIWHGLKPDLYFSVKFCT